MRRWMIALAVVAALVVVIWLARGAPFNPPESTPVPSMEPETPHFDEMLRRDKERREELERRAREPVLDASSKR